MYTVKALIKALKKCPQNAVICLDLLTIDNDEIVEGHSHSDDAEIEIENRGYEVVIRAIDET